MRKISKCCGAPLGVATHYYVCRNCSKPCGYEKRFELLVDATVTIQPSTTRFEMICKIIMDDAEEAFCDESFRQQIREYLDCVKTPYNILVVICNKTKEVGSFYA